MTLTDIIAKITLFAKRAIVNDNSSNTAVSINQTGSGTGLSVASTSGTGLSVKSVAGTSVLVENTNPVAGKGGKLEIFHPTNGDFVFDGGTDGLFVFTNTTATGTTGFNAAKTFFNGGNVGIGTSTPLSTLEVNGGIRASQGIPTAPDASNAGYAFGPDGDTGMFGLSTGGVAGTIIFYTNNAEQARVNTTGLGIGTTTPARKLHVNGLVRLQGLSVYANDAGAIAGGLVADDIYKTVTGELRIVV